VWSQMLIVFVKFTSFITKQKSSRRNRFITTLGASTSIIGKMLGIPKQMAKCLHKGMVLCEE
jgi:hypothetical protein